MGRRSAVGHRETENEGNLGVNFPPPAQVGSSPAAGRLTFWFRFETVFLLWLLLYLRLITMRFLRL